MARSWTPQTWQTFPVQQQPEWPDKAALDSALGQVSSFPPLVFAGEARSLQTALGKLLLATHSYYKLAIAPKVSKSSPQ
jgi:3-deoxy-7-phosphoheptulonate synthase